MTPVLAGAEESDQTHPYLSDRFQLAVGAFARQQDFKIGADGALPDGLYFESLLSLLSSCGFFSLPCWPLLFTPAASRTGLVTYTYSDLK
jgi:hypothetical protein